MGVRDASARAAPGGSGRLGRPARPAGALGVRLENGVLLAPVVLLVLSTAVFPGLYAYYMSVHEVYLEAYSEGRFTGLSNFARVLRDPDFFRAALFSLRFALLATAVELALGVLLALLFYPEFRGKRVAISLVLLPLMVSPALIGIMFRLMLNEFVGVVTYYVERMGIPFQPLAPRYVFWTLLTVDIVQWMPFTFLLAYAALQALPGELVEAGQVDGATGWQLFRHIMLPWIAPLLLIAALLRSIDAFKTFDMIHVLTGGGPGTLTTTLSIYIYKMAFLTGDLGRANAASVLMLLFLGLLIPSVLRRIFREGL